MLIISSVLIGACYSSTAVKGIPINQVQIDTGDEKDELKLTEAKRAKVAEMSKVNENNVFKSIGGFPEYRIGPLDVLEINTRTGEKTNTSTITVSSRGTISYSFIDDIFVVGLTPSELDNQLTEKLSDYVRKPRIDVLVKEFISKSAMVVGEFSKLRGGAQQESGSGVIDLEGKTTLMDLVGLAGGYTVNADIKKARLIRKGESYPINIYDIVERGDTTLNVIIDDGDVLNIPELPELGERVYVMGEVNAQGIYPLKDTQDLLAAISLAGSFTKLAKEENTLIVRGYEPGKKPLVMMADIDALLTKADLSQNITLKDGDLIYIPRMLIADINDWIDNTMTLLDFLFYPKDFQNAYSLRNYLHIDRRGHGN